MPGALDDPAAASYVVDAVSGAFHILSGNGSRKGRSMSYAENPYRSGMDVFAADAAVDERASFITKTYLHLAGAVGAFIALSAVLLQIPGIGELVNTMIGGRASWLIVIALFMGVSWIAQKWANSATSMATQYLGLSLYVVAQSIVTLPLLYIAKNFGGENVISVAGLITAMMFLAMTGVVFVTRKDFSFLRSMLMISGFAALGLIVASVVFGFSLGIVFVVAMIAFACGYILYDTSNVLHHYRIGQHVAAALALFCSAILLFWYVLQLVMSLNRR
jgi:FtsH-binding integral membrane protein